MEANTTALAGYGFVALSGAMSVLRWRSQRQSAQRFDRYQTDGHRRDEEREEGWYANALVALAQRK
jgi:hypothetical protein